MFSNLGYSSDSPWWYILNSPPNKEIEIEKIIENGILRSEFLKAFNSEITNLQNKNFNQINLLLESNYPGLTQIGDIDEIVEKYFLGHWFLRICSVFSSRIENWIIETEGDLFELFFNKISLNEKLKVFQLLAESEKKVSFVKLIQHELSIPNELVTADSVAIHWSLVPYLVSKKKGALFNGYMIAPFHIFYKSVKKLFEKKLKTEINKLKANDRFLAFFESNSLILNAIKELERNIQGNSKYDNVSLFFEDNEIEGVNLFEKQDLFPPCMRFLLQDVKETGYIKHNYRFQLGLFLKRIGMDIDSQLHFWYNLAVDNIGMSYDQFVRRAGYIIRHIYGLEGSKTDYEVPRCKKLKSDYFCLYSHINAEELTSILPKMYGKELSNLEEIIDLSKKQASTVACSKTFFGLYNKNVKISHPLLWMKMSFKTYNSTTNPKNEDKELTS